MSATVDYDNATRRLDVALSASGATYTLAAIVDFRSLLPEQVTLGFSAATGNRFVSNHTVLSFSFHSTLQIWNHTSLPSTLSAKNATLRLSAGVAAAAALVLLLVVAVAVLLWRASKRSKRPDDEEVLTGEDSHVVDDEDFESGTGPRPIPYAQGSTRCGDEGLRGGGEAGAGRVRFCVRGPREGARPRRRHQGVLEGGVLGREEGVQVRGHRHQPAAAPEPRAAHRLVPYGRKRLLLVYELVRNGSLDGYLYSKETLAWPMRYQIVLGLASAVLYLHQEWDQCVVHGDIKPSNIMLDESFNAKLSDFGLARLIDHGKSLQTMTAVAGTRGYLDPGCIINGKASTESDMYSFGVVLLEVACGRRPMAPLRDGGKDDQVFRLVEWVWDLYGRGASLDAADERLGDAFDRWEMERVVAVGLWCAHPDPKMRPAIRQAAEALQSRKFRMPVDVYLQPFGASSMQYGESTATVGSAVTMQHSSTSHATAKTHSSNSISPPAVSEHLSPRV